MNGSYLLPSRVLLSASGIVFLAAAHIHVISDAPPQAGVGFDAGFYALLALDWIPWLLYVALVRRRLTTLAIGFLLIAMSVLPWSLFLLGSFDSGYYVFLCYPLLLIATLIGGATDSFSWSLASP